MASAKPESTSLSTPESTSLSMKRVVTSDVITIQGVSRIIKHVCVCLPDCFCFQNYDKHSRLALRGTWPRVRGP